MARGGKVSPVEAPLPKASFQKIDDEVSTKPGGVHDLQARSYGYNDFSQFSRPDHYIRYIEPLESELAVQVEYDMDEQDQEWLDAINMERKKEHLDKVSYELFEIVMDRLEKEWFDLTKNIPKPDLALPSEDSTCAICDDSEGENSNAIVFCDGCNLAVHQDCYGVPYIPEGQWLCRKCTVSPENPVSCTLCPNEGGAFKQTVHGDWVHLLCAIWVPETRVANDVFMEPITGVDKISKQRWKLKCSICDVREGACIQCAKTSCFLAFHATCARKEKLLLPMKSTQGSEPVSLTCYCEKHLPKEQQEARAAALAAEEALDPASSSPHASPNESGKHSKSARAYAKTYKPGPPLVPALIVDRILQYIGKVSVRKKPDFVLMLCKYWSLKREARRGAPLLKRLHLEPWTASAGARVVGEKEKAMKLEQLQRLKEDLERVRALAELSRKRESRKLQQAEIIQDILFRALFPHESPLRMAFEKIMALDRQDFFKNPVSKADVPDYYDVVKRPICWNFIDEKLDRHEYWDIQDFKNDVHLVLDNAILYNKPGTPFYKAATRIRITAQPIMNDLDRLSTFHPKNPIISTADINPPTSTLTPSSTPDPTTDTTTPIGNLEPPLEILDLIFSTEALKDDLDIILKADPLSSLFSYEFAELKPPPPPPPPKPRKPPKAPKVPKPKRDRREEYQKRKQQRGAAAVALAAAANDAQAQFAFDTSPGFRMPRTRGAVAAAAAFEAEAGADRPAVEVEAEAASPMGEGGVDSIGTSKGAGKKVYKKKRPSTVHSGHSGVPPMVDDVDKQGLFTMFDAGWILPSGQRRRGRAPVDRSPQPPPKKRARLDLGVSQLSVFSTAASVNQTLQPASPSDMNHHGEGLAPKDDSMNVDEPPADESIIVETQPAERFTSAAALENAETVPARHPLAPGSIPLTNLIHTPNGTVIIEELDTPAIRREKNIRRKAERLRMTEASAAPVSALSDVPQVPLSSPGAGPYTVPVPVPEADGMFDTESELSSLSELDSDDTEDEGSVSVQRVEPPAKVAPERSIIISKAQHPERDPFAITLADGERLEGGTLVWAKADTYPWWPAVVFEPDDPLVPRPVWKQQKQALKRQNQSNLHLVRFFDKAQDWQWIGIERLMMLGDNPELDQELISSTSRRQRWKNTAVRHECRAAYRLACAEMETASDKGNNEDNGEGTNRDVVVQEITDQRSLLS